MIAVTVTHLCQTFGRLPDFRPFFLVAFGLPRKVWWHDVTRRLWVSCSDQLQNPLWQVCTSIHQQFESVWCFVLLISIWFCLCFSSTIRVGRKSWWKSDILIVRFQHIPRHRRKHRDRPPQGRSSCCPSQSCSTSLLKAALISTCCNTVDQHLTLFRKNNAGHYRTATPVECFDLFECLSCTPESWRHWMPLGSHWHVGNSTTVDVKWCELCSIEKLHPMGAEWKLRWICFSMFFFEFEIWSEFEMLKILRVWKHTCSLDGKLLYKQLGTAPYEPKAGLSRTNQLGHFAANSMYDIKLTNRIQSTSLSAIHANPVIFVALFGPEGKPALSRRRMIELRSWSCGDIDALSILQFIMFLRNHVAKHSEASRTNFLTTPMHGQDLTSKSRSIHRQKMRHSNAVEVNESAHGLLSLLMSMGRWIALPFVSPSYEGIKMWATPSPTGDAAHTLVTTVNWNMSVPIGHLLFVLLLLPL